MRPNADDRSGRYFEAACWYLPPMGGEPEPDPILACTYALLALYTKLDALTNAAPTSDAVAGRDLGDLLRTLTGQPPTRIRKGLENN